jgi:predicted ribosome quality control (RQC) complex YloA/Tae2 family protein
MIPPMKSLTAYALGLEMDAALGGCCIVGIESFFGGAALYLEGYRNGIWHLFYFGREPELVITDSAVIPRGNTRQVMKPLEGGRITGVSPLGMGRALVLSVETMGSWKDSNPYLLRLDLSPGGKAAALFSARGGRALETVGTERSRTAREAVSAAPPKPLSILQLPGEPPHSLLEALRLEETDGIPEQTRSLARARRAAEWLLDSIDGIDPTLAREITRSAKGSPEEIWSTVRSLGNMASRGEWSWCDYQFAHADEAILYPVDLPVCGPSRRFADFSEALRSHAEARVLPSYAAHLRHSISSAARKEIRKIERIASHVRDDISRAERAKEYRHLGNLLVAYRHRMKRGMGEISVTDFSGVETIVIPLDPAKTPDQNIEVYFKRAKKGDRGIMVLRSRRRAVESELEKKKRALEEIEGIDDPAVLASMLPGPVTRKRERHIAERDRYRTFELGNGLTVYVGRSDKENDRLTHRFASPSDLWFHAQGISGSHVILKGADRSTPKRVLEQVAAIAAFFSKARNSTTVPVVYAEKRFVRKPRKSKPGTAVCQRGTTIFVRPELPEKEQ